MRCLFTFSILVLLAVGCRKKDVIPAIDASVSSFTDLPTAYEPFQEGSSIPGRIKREIQNGRTSGEWRYNERGQMIEWRMFRLGNVESAVQYRYDENGHLRFVQQFSNNCGYSSVYNCTGPVEWVSYDELSTDASGRVMESRSYLKLDGNWDFRSKSVYEYNAQGQIEKVLRYDAKGTLSVTQTFAYDARGNVLSVREHNRTASPDLVDRTFTYKYDTGRNPYLNTVYYAAALFLSRNTQLAPGLTYNYRPDGLPNRIIQDGSVIELEYY